MGSLHWQCLISLLDNRNKVVQGIMGKQG